MEVCSSRSEIERNTQLANWEEVPRSKDILMVGDLHGNFEGYQANLEYVGARNNQGEWIGGDKPLVFLGDITSDRFTQGFEIMADIANLRDQAEGEGGNIITIAGNHDDFATSFLLNRGVANTERQDSVNGQNYLDSLTICGVANQGAGIVEFLKFLPDAEIRQESAIDDIGRGIVALSDAESLGMITDHSPYKKYVQQHKGRGPEVLANMKAAPEGHRLLEEFCKLQLAEQIDDSLFVHTPLTREMALYIIANGVDFINNIYQKVLRKHFLDEGEDITDYEEDCFEELRATFLSTLNKEPYSDIRLSNALKRKGINHVFHGHVGPSYGRTINRWGMELTSLDLNAFRDGDHSKLFRSTGIIKASDGSVITGTDQLLIRPVR